MSRVLEGSSQRWAKGSIDRSSDTDSIFRFYPMTHFYRSFLKVVGNEMNGGWWAYVNDRYINGTAALEVFFHFDRLVSL